MAKPKRKRIREVDWNDRPISLKQFNKGLKWLMEQPAPKEGKVVKSKPAKK